MAFQTRQTNVSEVFYKMSWNSHSGMDASYILDGQLLQPCWMTKFLLLASCAIKIRSLVSWSSANFSVMGALLSAKYGVLTLLSKLTRYCAGLLQPVQAVADEAILICH